MASDAADRHTATFSATYDDERSASIVARSVEREVGDIDGDRTVGTVERRGRTVRVRVTAADLVALRAGTNTWCSLLGVAERAVAAADARRSE